MEHVAHSGISVRPNNTLDHFARENLLSASDWAEFDRVKSAKKPNVKTTLVDGMPRQERDTPSPDYLRRLKLEELLRQQFREELQSGRWSITAIPPGAFSRQKIASELIENAKTISFANNTVGRFIRVEISECSGADRYSTLKWFIEQVCQVVPPKRGVRKEQVQDLAERLLDFDVRDDLFKSAWTDANIPVDFRKPGR